MRELLTLYLCCNLAAGIQYDEAAYDRGSCTIPRPKIGRNLKARLIRCAFDREQDCRQLHDDHRAPSMVVKCCH